MRAHLALSLLTGALLAASTSISAAAREEIVVALDPRVLQQLPGESRESFFNALLSRYGVGNAIGFDKLGSGIFAVPEDLSREQARALIRKIAKGPGVLAAAVRPGAAERKAMEQRKLFDAAAAERTVLGVIVKYRDASMQAMSRDNQPLPPDELARLGQVAGASFVRSRAMSGDAFAVRLAEPIDAIAASALLSRLDSDPQIEYANPDELVQTAAFPDDPLFGKQWSLTHPTAGIDAPGAWQITTGSPATVVAVVDTGILNHPDLAGRVLPGYDFISDPAWAGDGDGRDGNAADAGNWRPADFCFSGSPAKNSNWHGTHVAGIIAATGNNATGIAGIDWQAKILPVRVLGKCGGSTSDIADGMRWAAGLAVPGVPANPTPARVINMSLGGKTPCSKNEAEQYAAIEILANGAALVVAAGNDADDATNYSPAGCYGVITVGATGPNGDRAPYSNYSDLAVDVSAPGGNLRDFGAAGEILSTLATGTQSNPGSMAYVPYQGTSMAAPHVSGVIALMLAANPGLTIAQINDIVLHETKPFAAGSDCAVHGDCGRGIVNAGMAVAAAKAVIGKPLNFTDHWFNPFEVGWGVQVTAQGNVQFVTWYTYANDGSPVWLIMVLEHVSQDIFAGPIYYTTGVPMQNINGKPAYTDQARVGTGFLAFFDHDSGWLVYDIFGYNSARPLFRLEFAAPLTECVFTTAPLADAVNYQGMWWNPPESGWGLNITHQGNLIFATWFTFGQNGEPVWLLMVGTRVAPGVYSGNIEQTTGIPLSKMNWTQAYTTDVIVGTGTLTFTSGDRGRFDYTAYGFTGSKPIERQLFASPWSKCMPAL